MCECYEKVKAQISERIFSQLPKGSSSPEVTIDSYAHAYGADGEYTSRLSLEFSAYYSAPDGRKLAKHGHSQPSYCPFCGEHVGEQA